jgi:type II secretory pathway pseudopilin PulG
MDQKTLLRNLLAVIIFLLIVTGIIGTIYFYGQAQNQKQSKEDCQNELTELRNQVTTQDKATTDNKEESDNCSTLTEEEEALVSDWTEYEDDNSNYSLKYPSDWELSENQDMIKLSTTVDGESVDFEVRTGITTEIGFGQFQLESTEKTEVSCQEATKVTYNGENDFTKVTQSFDYSGTPYLLTFTYTDLGASYSGDLIELYNTILKTFTLN